MKGYEVRTYTLAPHPTWRAVYLCGLLCILRGAQCTALGNTRNGTGSKERKVWKLMAYGILIGYTQ